jgi:putative two-component system response regulator
VLLVDDSDEQRNLYAEMLRSRAAVSTAARGEHALALASADPPDVIVLDVMMPGMDGWETCARLKADPATKGIPIIMLTSLDAVDVPARARQAGAVAVLMKPCPAERLILTINAARQPIPNADGDLA